jgi:hypothetical protein
VTLVTLGLLRGGYIVQEVSVLLGCLNGDVGSFWGIELWKTNPCVSMHSLCDLLKFLSLARILGFALDLLVEKVLTVGSWRKEVETSLETLEITSIYFWLRFDWSNLVSTHFSGVSEHFFGISESCGDSGKISGDFESY